MELTEIHPSTDMSSAMKSFQDQLAELAELDSPRSEAEAIKLISAAEQLKSTATALQAATTALLEQTRHADEAARGVPRARRGKGLHAEVGFARGESPARGTTFLETSRALMADLPNTYTALQNGEIHEEHAQIVAKETVWLSAEHRQNVDARLAGHFTGVGPSQLRTTVRGHAQALDHRTTEEREATARRARRVYLRPAPEENMAQFVALLPMPQAAAVLAALDAKARSMVGTPDAKDPVDPNCPRRTKDQIMADLFVERANGQNTSPAVPVEISLVMSDQALFGDDETPAWIPGHGPVSADTARQWITDPNTEASLRRLFTSPDNHELVAMDSKSRKFPDGLRKMVRLRDGICKTPYCDAPIRQIDHIKPHRNGGATNWSNASGLCAACNQTKENIGWRHQATPDGLTVKTPTGNTYSSPTRPLLPGQSQHQGRKPPDDQSPPKARPQTSNFRATDASIRYTMRIAA